MMLKLATLLAATAMMASLAIAQNGGEAHWEDVANKMVAVDGSDSNRGTDFYTLIHIVGTKGTDGAILTLSCQQSTSGRSLMQAAIQLDPENDYESNPKRKLRTVNRNVTLDVGGKLDSSRWSYHPASSKIVPADRKIPRRLFNAIVKQQAVSVKTQDGTYELGLPPMNPVFKRFVKRCPITNGTNEVDMSLFESVRASEAAKKAAR